MDAASSGLQELQFVRMLAENLAWANCALMGNCGAKKRPLLTSSETNRFLPMHPIPENSPYWTAGHYSSGWRDYYRLWTSDTSSVVSVVAVELEVVVPVAASASSMKYHHAVPMTWVPVLSLGDFQFVGICVFRSPFEQLPHCAVDQWPSKEGKLK